MSTTSGWVVAGLAAASLFLLVPARARVDPLREGSADGHAATTEVSLLRRLRPLLAAVAAAGGWSLLGGTAGVVAAPVAGAAAWVLLGRGEDPATVRRRERLVADLPLGVDLLAACLEAGAPPERAVATVGRAVGGPVEEELVALLHRLQIGVDPARAWRALGDQPALAPLGRAVASAQESGASVSRAVHQLAEELAERQQGEVEQRARSIEVRAAAPLGLCLLPAFVLLGVVPLVAGVFASMRVFG